MTVKYVGEDGLGRLASDIKTWGTGMFVGKDLDDLAYPMTASMIHSITGAAGTGTDDSMAWTEQLVNGLIEEMPFSLTSELTEVPSNFFSNCVLLKRVSYPECVTIQGQAFYSCRSLEEVDFPECTTIEDSAFSGCIGLKSLSFPKCTYIGGSAFCNCHTLESVEFDEVVTIFSYAFSCCYGLKTVSFPKCRNVYERAFASCALLETAYFNQASYLAAMAFGNCSNLASVYLLSSSYVKINSTTFTASPRLKIYVPSSLYDGYSSQNIWSSIFSCLVPI